MSLKEILNGVNGTRRLAGHERAAVSLRESSQEEKKEEEAEEKKRVFHNKSIVCSRENKAGCWTLNTLCGCCSRFIKNNRLL